MRMGFRFRRSIRIAPGVRLNLNKRSMGVSVGGKGLHYSVNSKGRRTSTIGIPGSGLSYQQVSTPKKRGGRQASLPASSPLRISAPAPVRSTGGGRSRLLWLLFFVGIVVLVLMVAH